MLPDEGVEQLELKSFTDTAAKSNRAHEAQPWGGWRQDMDEEDSSEPDGNL